MAPLLSVIVPTHNRPGLLRHALESVMLQTVEDWECIVVDDGGTTPIELPDDRFRLHRHESPRGPAAARNSGIEASEGRVLCFLDDDDAFTPRRLDIALRGLDLAPLTICFSGPLNGTPRSGSGAPRTLTGRVHDVILDSTAPQLGTVAVLRDHMTPFDPSYVASQDLEWWLRISKEVPVSTVPEVGLLWRTHDGDRSINSDKARIQASHRLLAEYGDYFATHKKAKAFRYQRIAAMEQTNGNHGAARTALLQSLRTRPSLSALRQFVRLGGAATD